jgi:hypothetical protein
MSPEQIFTVTNTVAVVGWILLAVLPGRRWVTETVTGKVLPGLFAAMYITLVAMNFFTAEGSFSTLVGVSALFSNPWLLVAGWLHYLAFDLLIGTWEARDARDRGIPHLVLVPCLFLTLMFGPAGWLIYIGVRRARAHIASPVQR